MIDCCSGGKGEPIIEIVALPGGLLDLTLKFDTQEIVEAIGLVQNDDVPNRYGGMS